MYLLAIAVMFLGVSHPFILINFGVEPKIESWAGVGYFWAFVVTAPGIVLFILSFLSATIALNVNAHKIYKLKRIEK